MSDQLLCPVAAAGNAAAADAAVAAAWPVAGLHVAAAAADAGRWCRQRQRRHCYSRHCFDYHRCRCQSSWTDRRWASRSANSLNQQLSIADLGRGERERETA